MIGLFQWTQCGWLPLSVHFLCVSIASKLSLDSLMFWNVHWIDLNILEVRLKSGKLPRISLRSAAISALQLHWITTLPAASVLGGSGACGRSQLLGEFDWTWNSVNGGNNSPRTELSVNARKIATRTDRHVFINDSVLRLITCRSVRVRLNLCWRVGLTAAPKVFPIVTGNWLVSARRALPFRSLDAFGVYASLSNSDVASALLACKQAKA